MKPAAPKLVIPVNPTFSCRPRATRTYTPASTPTPVQKPVSVKKLRVSPSGSSDAGSAIGIASDHLRLAEDSLRADDQRRDQDHEPDPDLPASVDEQGGPLGHH